MRNNDFVAFILTHGRADNVLTTDALKKHGYTGRVMYIVDDEDEQQQKYIDKFGRENVYIFNKDEIAKTFDRGDNFGKKGVIIYARNVCFKAAQEIGVKYFIQLDDDYTSFGYRFDSELEFRWAPIKNLDETLDAMLEYYKSANFATIAMTQGGDYVGGGNGLAKSIRAKRKAMNSFICSTDRPFTFVGTINEDVNTYTLLGSKGELIMTLPIVCLQQKQTQANKGGMTETYLESGTYLKSFYSVMYMPSCVKIATMGNTNRRIHHSVQWRYCVPKILRVEHKK